MFIFLFHESQNWSWILWISNGFHICVRINLHCPLWNIPSKCLFLILFLMSRIFCNRTFHRVILVYLRTVPVRLPSLWKLVVLKRMRHVNFLKCSNVRIFYNIQVIFWFTNVDNASVFYVFHFFQCHSLKIFSTLIIYSANILCFEFVTPVLLF